MSDVENNLENDVQHVVQDVVEDQEQQTFDQDLDHEESYSDEDNDSHHSDISHGGEDSDDEEEASEDLIDPELLSEYPPNENESMGVRDFFKQYWPHCVAGALGAGLVIGVAGYFYFRKRSD